MNKEAARRSTTLAAILAIVSCGAIAAHAQGVSLPDSAQKTTQAWNLLGKRDYAGAYKIAGLVVSTYRVQAIQVENDLQAKIKAGKATVPPTGTVGAAEKAKIFANGLLNDVATCLFIQGKAMEGANNTPSAKAAFTDCLKFDLGRCWDPGGWFWSPAAGAQTELDGLG